MKLLFLSCPRILDEQFLVPFEIPAKLFNAPSIVPILWHPRPYDWVNVNIDGLAKGNPSPVACGEVFRDSTGLFSWWFLSEFGVTYFPSMLSFMLSSLPRSWPTRGVGEICG